MYYKHLSLQEATLPGLLKRQFSLTSMFFSLNKSLGDRIIQPRAVYDFSRSFSAQVSVKTWHWDPLPESFCLISIKRTKNNTHCVISNLFGNLRSVWSMSSGQLTKTQRSGGRRKTRLSQRLIFKSAAEKALGLGFENAVIHCRGSRGSKTQIYRSFSSALKVILLKDLTGLAHNGCRPPKARRI